jgi:hypothetical protein
MGRFPGETRRSIALLLMRLKSRVARKIARCGFFFPRLRTCPRHALSEASGLVPIRRPDGSIRKRVERAEVEALLDAGWLLDDSVVTRLDSRLQLGSSAEQTSRRERGAVRPPSVVKRLNSSLDRGPAHGRGRNQRRAVNVHVHKPPALRGLTLRSGSANSLAERPVALPTKSDGARSLAASLAFAKAPAELGPGALM